MMESNRDPPSLWPQLGASMPRRRSSSPLLSPPLLIIILPIAGLLLLFFAVPPFLSATSHILRPNSSVKKSWDSLNILLVLFAILCGVFARRNDDDSSSRDDNNVVNVARDAADEKGISGSQQWFDQYSADRGRIYNTPPMSGLGSGAGRLRRSSSSYPDLRQDSLWETGDDRFRFFDDYEISKYRSPATSDHHHVQFRRRRGAVGESEAKVIPVDTFVIRTSSPPPPMTPMSPEPPPPPPPPPPVVDHKPRRTYQSPRNKDKVEKARERVVQSTEITTPPPTPPPPPPPPPPPVRVMYGSEPRFGKIERRKSNATKEIKMALASFIHNQRKKKKKQKTKNAPYDIHHHHLHSPIPEPSPYNYSTIPPPPPPPPPPSVFHSLFRKGSKGKRVHSVPAPPPPPPPPPAQQFSSTRSSKRKSHVQPPPPPPPAPPTPPRRRTPVHTGRPPLPIRLNNFHDENISSGSRSPVIPMPPPPPPPPFRMPEMKFVRRGGFVRIRSAQSSRCGSPELDDIDLSPSKAESETASVIDDDDDGRSSHSGGGSVFCHSPDVNAKADTFIARLRDGWRLEKMNSMREQQKTGHFPGPQHPATRTQIGTEANLSRS